MGCGYRFRLEPTEVGGAPTLLDVCSYLGVGREGQSGEQREGGLGWVTGVWSPGVRRLSVGLASCSFEGQTGEKLAKEVEREVGTLGAGLPDVLRLTWGAGLSGAVLEVAGLLGGGNQQDHP